MLEIEVRVRDFIVKSFLFGRGEDKLTSDASLLERGVVDSTGVLEIVVFLEEQFGLEVADQELIPEHFDSIAKLTRFVARKRGEG